MVSPNKGKEVIAGTAVLGVVAAFLLLRRRNKDDGKARSHPISTQLISTNLVQADPNIIFAGSSSEDDGPIRTELREKMSEVDEWLTKSSHWLGFCYRFDSVLDEAAVRAGLERTLAHFPALGARVDTNSDPISYQFVLTPERHGVVLEIAHGKLDPSSREGGGRLPDESDTREEWKRAGLDAPGAGFNGEPGPDDPLMRARLTIFESSNVSYLSVGISHGLGDGHSITDILRTWSHFCVHDSAEGLPENLRRQREFGKRFTEPARPAKDFVELQERVKNDVGCDIDPLSRRAFYGQVLPRAIMCMSRQRTLEVRVSKEKMVALKAAIVEALPKGEWVSTFEVLCAAILVAQRVTSAIPIMAEEHTIHVGTDLRDRAKRFPSDYFGNAAFDFRRTLEQLPREPSWNMSNVTAVAVQVHKSIRSGLADPEDITRSKDWFEAARHLGYRNTYDIWPIVFDILKGTGTFVNSWDSKWLDISMGAEEGARAFCAYFGTMQNIIVEVPRERISGDSTIYLALPAGHSKRFVEFCQSYTNQNVVPGHPPFPFSIVQ